MLLSLPLPLLLEPRRGELEPRSDDEPRIPSSELELSELERSEIERSELELPLRPPVLPLLDEPERPDELPELPGAFIPPCRPVLLDEPRDDPPLFCDAPMPP